MRKTTDFINGCLDITKGTPIPDKFSQWTAISAVAGALGRKCWFSMVNYEIRPNIFVVLIAPPGRNKSVSLILPFSKVFSKLTTPIGTEEDHEEFNSGLTKYGLKNYPLHFIQDRITPEKLAVEMQKVSRLDLRVGNTELFYDSSLTLVTSEFGTFMNRTSQYLQMFLTDMWDSKDSYSHQIKTGSSQFIKGPCLNWIACATPEQFVDNLPEDARSQGLLSRIIPVFYDGEKIPQSLLQDRVEDSTIHNLRNDLSEIAKMYGPMRFDDRAFDKINQDIESGLKPIPTDANLAEYTQRRVSHFIKVALAVSASSSKDKVITWDQWQRTKDLMFEVEENMPKALAGFGMARAGKLAQDMAVWTKETMLNTERNFVSLRHFKRELLRRTLAPGESEQTVKAMEEAGYIQVKDGLVFPMKL